MTLLRRAAAAFALKQNTERPPTSYGGSSLPTLGLGMQTSMLGSMAAYGAVGWLFAVVSRIAQGVAAPDWHLYRPVRPGERTEVEQHEARDLWNSPNPFYTQAELIESSQQHLDLVGEAWWVLLRAGRRPAEIWPVRPDRMKPVPHRTEYIAGYVYTMGAEKIPLEREDVIFLRLPNPLDPYRGLGPVQSILADLDSERFSALWNRNFFMNSAEPGGIIEFADGIEDEDEFERLRDRWNRQHQGVARSHRVAILERGHWVDRKFSMRDMQFEQMRKVNRDLILGAFGFPKHILGIAEDVNRANAEAAELMFSRWIVRPRLERIRQALNERLLPLFGGGLEFDFEDPTPADRALALEEAKVGFATQALTTNEIRRRLGEADRPDGNAITVPQMAVLLEPEVKALSRGLADSIPMARARAANLLTPAVARLLEKQAAEVVRRLSALAGEKPDAQVSAVDESELWPDGQDEALAEAIAPAVGRVARAVIALVDGTLRRSAKASEEEALVQLILRESADNVVRINEATRQAIRNALSEAADLGLNLYATVNGNEAFAGLRAVVQEFYRGRAETIARTETAWAANEASMGRYGQLGVAEIDIIDGDVDEACASRNGTRVALSERPQLAHPSCTLVLVPVVPERALLAEARCPQCHRTLGRNVLASTIRCAKCKQDVRFEDGAAKVLTDNGRHAIVSVTE